MLLPVTFTLAPVSAMIMLAGIYYGAQYGGSTSAILINLPGEITSVATVLDGHAMAKQGRAGVALATAAIGSFVAGTISTFLLAAFAPPLAELALKFGRMSILRSWCSGWCVDRTGARIAAARGRHDPARAAARADRRRCQFRRTAFHLRCPGTRRRRWLRGGGHGMFGLGEIAAISKTRRPAPAWSPHHQSHAHAEDFRRMVAPILRGTFIGSALGILPGNGAVLGSFTSYSVEKKLSKTPEQFGKARSRCGGTGVGQYAGAQTSFIPMLTLGIPSTPVMALMIGALIIQGIQPGPTVVTNQPALFWGIIVSMWIGNVFLLILNLPLIGMWCA